MCSGIALLGVTAVMVVPTGLGAALGVGINLSDNEIQGIVYAALFIWYFLCTLVAVFCDEGAHLLCAAELLGPATDHRVRIRRGGQTPAADPRVAARSHRRGDPAGRGVASDREARLFR